MIAVTLGRGPDVDIVIDDEYASNRHCRIERQDVGRYWRVVDLGSTNGTRVIRDGRTVPVPLGTPVALLAGDVIVVGRTRLPPFTPPDNLT